jgi:toxin CcdB
LSSWRWLAENRDAKAAVSPLCKASATKGKSIGTFTPVIAIEGKPYVMLTPQLEGVSRRDIGAAVADLHAHRDEIIAGLDLLITGI